jgi:LysR family transcriptional regulator, cys regulon transcriptional activator
LPDVVKEFARKLPDVRMRLRQGYPAQCEQAVVSGDADVALYTEVERPHPEVAFIPVARLRRSVITPPRHELIRQTPLTLNAVARHPIITYDEAFSGRRVLDRAFEAKGLKPNIVMTAIDADVSKAYVELGIGIAILATITFDQKRDWPLRRIDASHLFPSSILGVAVRRKGYLRRPVLTLVSLLAPRLGQRSIEKALASGSLPIKNLPEF